MIKMTLRKLTNQNDDFSYLNDIFQNLSIPAYTYQTNYIDSENPSFSAIALHILSKKDIKERLIHLIQAFDYIPFYCFSERHNVDHFFKNNSQAFEEIIHSHELIDTIEYVQLMNYLPCLLSKLALKPPVDFILELSKTNKKRKPYLFHNHVLTFLVKNYDLNVIIDGSFALIKENPMDFMSLHRFIQKDLSLLNQFIPYVLKNCPVFIKKKIINNIYEIDGMDPSLLHYFKTIPNDVIHHMPPLKRIEFAQESFVNNTPFIFDNIKLDSDMCIALIDELKMKYPSDHDKLSFLINKGLILKKNFNFLAQFCPQVLDKLKKVYDTNQLLGIHSKKEVINHLQAAMNMEFTDLNLDIL